MKSPFIEFTSEFELLSNASISLNISASSTPTLRQQQKNNGLHNLGNFINPISHPNRENDKTFKGINNTTFSIQSDLIDGKDSRKHQEKHLYQLQQQQIQELQQHNLNKSATNKILMDIIKPIVTDSYRPAAAAVDDDDGEANNNNHPDQPTIQIIANSNMDSHHQHMQSSSNQMNNYPTYDDSRERKVIMPLALKTTLIERERPIPTPLPKPQTNIDDLKKHILMLQNFTENDKNFQSKFVVFPKMRGTSSTTSAPSTTTPRPITTTTMPFPMTMYRTKPSINMPALQNSQILRDVSYPFSRVERVTVVPQVFLQNDQQQPDTDDEVEDDRRRSMMEERRKNRKNEKKPKKDRKRNKNKEAMNNKAASNNNKVQNMLPPPTTTSTTTTTTAVPSRKAIRREQRRKQQQQQNFVDAQKTPIRYEKSLNGSQVLIASAPTAANTPYIINLNDKHIGFGNENSRKLSRTIRSKSQSGSRRRNQNKMQRDVLVPIEAANGNSSSKNESSDKIDLNPKHCYEVSGMSKGQQKLCEQYTSIMPAISRGARAAIQVSRCRRRQQQPASDTNPLFS